MKHCILCFDELSAQMSLTSVFGRATSLPAASGGGKGKRSVRRGLQKTSLLHQAMFSQGTTSGKVDPPPVPIHKKSPLLS